MNADDYEAFLLKEIAGPLAEFVTEDSAQRVKCFHAKCVAFCKKEDAYHVALRKAQKKAEKDTRLQDNNDGKAPKTGMRWYDIPSGHVEDYQPEFNGFWSDPLLFSPDQWIRKHYGWRLISYMSAHDAKEPHPRENLMCEFVVLALIHDEVLEVPESSRLCSIDHDDWRWMTWDCLKLDDTACQDGALISQLLKTALTHVKAELREKDGQVREAHDCGKTDSPNEKTAENWLWKLYEKTIKVAFDAILEKLNPS